MPIDTFFLPKIKNTQISSEWKAEKSLEYKQQILDHLNIEYLYVSCKIGNQKKHPRVNNYGEEKETTCASFHTEAAFYIEHDGPIQSIYCYLDSANKQVNFTLSQFQN